MGVTQTPPSLSVLKAFRIGSQHLVPLGHNPGDAFRVDDVVLKRVENGEEASWIASTLGSVRPAGFRLPKPVATLTGAWLEDDWSCWEVLAGGHEPGRWTDIIAAGDAFHRSVADVARPPWLDRATNLWRRADCFAWGEGPAPVGPLDGLLKRLDRLLRHVQLKSQIVHADLTGNVLFHAGEAPGIIDFSLYWRPVDYAAAIVAIDAFEWEGAGERLLDSVADRQEGEQLLIRAALFRVGASTQSHKADATKEVHARTIEVLERRARLVPESP